MKSTRTRVDTSVLSQNSADVTILFRYYEEKITRLEQTANHEMEELSTVARRAAEERKELEQKLSVASRERAKTDQKISSLSGKVSKMASELGEERQLNKSLRSYQAEWQKKLSEADTRAKEMEKQKNAEITDLKVRRGFQEACKPVQMKLSRISGATQRPYDQSRCKQPDSRFRHTGRAERWQHNSGSGAAR